LGIVGGDNITVEDCIFMDCDRAGTMMEETRDGTVRNCFYRGGEMGLCTGDNLYRLLAHDNRMEGNEIGIYLGGAIGATVHNNTIAGSSEHGLYLEYVFDSHVEGNRIDDGPIMVSPGKGISANHLYDTMIRDNLVLHTDIGMDLEWTFDCQIMNNTVDSALNEGVRFDGSDNCTIVGNLFYRNGGLGVTMVSDHGPTMDDIVWGNSFLFNNGATTVYQSGRYQAQDASSFNNWTSQSEGKGNYWSDWTSPDTDSDNIVDIPYTLLGGVLDEKPLVEQPLLLVTPPMGIGAEGGRFTNNVTWGAPLFSRSGEISGYRVYRSVNHSAPALLQELPADALHLVDMNVDNGVIYDYSVMAFNRYGDGELGQSVRAIPDSSPPKVNITSPMDGSFWNVTNLDVTWESSDDSGIANHRLRLDEGNWTDTGANTSVHLTNLTEGDHSLDLEVIDTMGNEAADRVVFHIDITPPEVDIVEPAYGAVLSSSVVAVKWVGEDVSYDAMTYRYRSDEGNWTEFNGTTITLTGLSEGEHRFEIEVRDLAKNSAKAATAFTVDTISPVVEILTPSEGEVISGRPILASWTANGTGSSITGLRTKLDSGPWRDIGIASNETLMGLEKGNHTYWVSATDGAGNSGTASVSFRVASEIPEPPAPGKGLILGRVLDKDGDPVHMVKVRSDKGEETFTDSEGYFFIEVEAGRRTLTFSKKGYRTYDRIIEVTENGTVQMDPVAMEERSDEKRAGLEWWYFCLCCLLPFVLLLLMFMVIGAMARIRRSRRRMLDEE
jgi:parallel beta-helix repeat protein